MDRGYADFARLKNTDNAGTLFVIRGKKGFRFTWVAVAVFVLVAIVNKELKLDQSLYTILQISSVTLSEKELINQVLSEYHDPIETLHPPKQMKLFDI